MTTCLELVVLADEMIDQVRHFKRLPVIDAETLALEAIDQVGPAEISPTTTTPCAISGTSGIPVCSIAAITKTGVRTADWI